MRTEFALLTLNVLLATTAVRAASPGSFAYVLQADRLAETKDRAVSMLTACDRDWIVIDASFHGDDESRWTPAELDRIRSGKEDRKVIAYLSIGEAEDYRSYWKDSWKRQPPDFLMKENPDWAGNYGVKFWLKSWQKILLTEVDKLMAQGFDGLYLDKVDIYEHFEYDASSEDWIDNRPNPATGQTYRADMIAWVQSVAERARQRRTTLIIPQNANALLVHAAYRSTISAIGVEDLFTDGERRQPRRDIKYRSKPLQLLADDQKPVLCIDYSKDSRLREYVRQSAQRYDYRLLITDRELTAFGQCW